MLRDAGIRMPLAFHGQAINYDILNKNHTPHWLYKINVKGNLKCSMYGICPLPYKFKEIVMGN